VIEICDLSEEESMDYLNKRGIDEAEAKKLYELVGGRIVDLKSVSDKALKGQPFEGMFGFDILHLMNLCNFALDCFLQTISAVIKQKILTGVEFKLRTTKLLQRQDYYDVGKHVIKALLGSKELSRTAFEEFFNKLEDADEVLKSNVFAYHPERNTITFQSRTIETYILENASMYIH
jgi:hypothetical protein